MNDDSRQEVLGLIQEWETQQEVRLGVQQRAALVEHIYAFGLGITESAWRRTIMSRYVSTTNPLVRYPGVSDVAQMVRRSPRALMAWAANEAFAGRDFRDTAQRAADVGTLVHRAVYAYLHGKDVTYDTDDPDIRQKAEKGFTAFERWREQSAITVEAAEVEIVSDVLKVGGRFDALLMHGRARVMADWKTGAQAYPEMLAQLAGYGLLWEEAHPDQKIDGYMLVRFDRESGDYHVDHFEIPFEEAREAFLCARRLWELEGLLTKRLR